MLKLEIDSSISRALYLRLTLKIRVFVTLIFLYYYLRSNHTPTQRYKHQLFQIDYHILVLTLLYSRSQHFTVLSSPHENKYG